MEMFKTRDDVEAWLAPMNYDELWIAIQPWCLVMPYTRAECDASLAAGADVEDLKVVLKASAEYLLAKRHGLTRKPTGPVLRVVSGRD